LENSLASCCREFRSIVTSEHFWKRKLARSGLPLLQKGKSFAQWKSIYRFSLQVAREAANKKSMLLSLCKIPSLDYLTCDEVGKEKIFGFFSLARKYQAYRHSSELFVYVSLEGYGTRSSLSYKIFSAERKDFFTSKFAKKILFYVPLSEKSYNLLLYKLTYAQ
ncbi:F-box domain-containing protein, partial [Brazilian cedratvirus IHUMI]